MNFLLNWTSPFSAEHFFISDLPGTDVSPMHVCLHIFPDTADSEDCHQCGCCYCPCLVLPSAGHHPDHVESGYASGSACHWMLRMYRKDTRVLSALKKNPESQNKML